jgi:hypothetical protein
VEEAARLAEDAVRASEAAKAEVDALRLAEKAANRAAAEAGLLNNNLLAQGYDKLAERLTAQVTVRGNAQTLRTFSTKMDDVASLRVADDLKAIANKHMGGASGEMTGAQFNSMMDDLARYADSKGIKITKTLESKGVYPNGLSEIKIAQFGHYDDLGKLVSAGDRHELAHMFHMIQMRATAIESLGRGGTLSAGATAEANAFLKIVESNGEQYRQLEKAVTRLSNPTIHRPGRAASEIGRYANRVDDLIDGTRAGMNSGKIAFPNGAGFEDVYALVVSKAPIVVGTGIKDLFVTRFPAMLFGTYYTTNPSVTSLGINPAAWGIEGGDIGFRDFVNAVLAEGVHPVETP